MKKKIISIYNLLLDIFKPDKLYDHLRKTEKINGFL